MDEPTPESIAVERAAGLRALADLVEATPEINATYLDDINAWNTDDPAMLAAIARAALAHGFKVDKSVDDQLYRVVVSRGRFQATALAWRNKVCERVVVGTETVTEKVKDPDALAKVPEVEQTVEREVVEWKCAPLLEAGAS